MGKKNQKKVTTVYGDLAFKHEQLEVMKVGRELAIRNANSGKKLKSTFICHGPKAAVDWIFADKTGITNVTINTTPEDLLKFAQKIMKDKKKMSKLGPIYFRHLSPDVSFIIRSKK